MARTKYFDRRGKPYRGAGHWRDGKRYMRVARHEAAHAVVAELLGMPVLRLRILGSEHGYCESVNGKSTLALAIRAMAGTIADHYWHRLPRRLWSSGDARAIRRLGYRDGLSKWLLEDFTRHIMNKPLIQRQIHAVARALKIRDLTGKEVRILMRLAR